MRLRSFDDFTCFLKKYSNSGSFCVLVKDSAFDFKWHSSSARFKSPIRLLNEIYAPSFDADAYS